MAFFKAKEWKHARRREISFLRELVGAGALLALAMAVFGWLGEDGARTADVAVAPSAVAGSDDALASPPAAMMPQAEADPLIGRDPVADPELFQHLDAMATYDRVVAYLPGMELPPPVEVMPPAPSQRLHVVVDKVGHTITVFEGGELVRQYGVAVGKAPGNKTRVGDMRTPEGTFSVTHVHDASTWVHDFGDGKGVITGAYGPIFIRLGTYPWNGIGIHGTHDPDSIGTDATEGCIRMHNDDLVELSSMVSSDTTVTILPN